MRPQNKDMGKNPINHRQQNESSVSSSRRKVLKNGGILTGIPYLSTFEKSDNSQRGVEKTHTANKNFNETVDICRIASEKQLKSWLTDKAQFNKGFMPTGSPAHENYVNLLTERLQELGVKEVTQEQFTFTRWNPTNWSLILNPNSTPQPLPVAGYIPYSGSTSAGGIDAPLRYLTNTATDGSRILLDGQPFAKGLESYDVTNSIVAVEVPVPELSLKAIRDQFYLVNEPIPDTLEPTHFTGLLGVPQIQKALSEKGAAGMVTVLPFGPDGANNLYAPFPGTIADVPGLYLDQFTGKQLHLAIQNTQTHTPKARLRLEAQINQKATARNIVGVVPAPSENEIVISSHTDGTNTNEDNGPAALLALAEYFLQIPRGQRPVTLRFVFTGGHFAHNAGLKSYVKAHREHLTENVLTAIELEHLGALEWVKQSDGSFDLTGNHSLQLMPVTESEAVVEESIRFGREFDRLFVNPSSVLYFGAGDEWMEVTELIQYITGDNYLLSYNFPDRVVTNKFHDYSLLRRQIASFAQMIHNLGESPVSAFEKPYSQS
jgi:hypothetical protein